MSNESETSGERRKRIARPPLTEDEEEGEGKGGRRAGAESSLHNKRQLNEGAASRARPRPDRRERDDSDDGPGRKGRKSRRRTEQRRMDGGGKKESTDADGP